MTGLGFARAAVLARVGETWERWQLRTDHEPALRPPRPRAAPPTWSTGDPVVDLDPADPQVRALLGDATRTAPSSASSSAFPRAPSAT
jgi:hypothetical protein